MRFGLAISGIALLSLLSDYAIAGINFGSGANSFEIEFVTIGDPGNAPDMTGAPNPAGAVEYVYNIGKFEISRDMVTKANAEGGLGITLFDYSNFGGNRPNRPATGVSWNEAARFTNWLNTSQGFSPAYKFNTLPGGGGYDVNANIELWVNGDAGFDANNPFRNSQARYFLPSVDEWYKAAYFDPTANGGAGAYWDFTTGSNTAPTAVAGGTAPNTAVYGQAIELGPADIFQAGGLSPYGVMGLGGNVAEWEETEFDLMNDNGAANRGARGGGWHFPSSSLAASNRDFSGGGPTFQIPDLGFRVASIPEPSSLLLGLFGMLGLVLRRRTAR